MIHTNQRIIKHKVGLLNLAEELGNISHACKTMGVSRDTFYRYKEAVEQGGVEALLDKSRRAPNLKNRVNPSVEQAVLEYAIEDPAHGQARVSNELRKKGVFVSPSGVRSIWIRHDLANFKQRLKALEEKVAREGIILTEAQVKALERKNWMMRSMVRLIPPTLVTLALKTRSMLAHSKVLVVFTNRPTLIPTQKWFTANCTQRKPPLQRRICSMTRYCHFIRMKSYQCFAY